MLYELPFWMHFTTEYQTFSNLVQEDLYRIAYCYTHIANCIVSPPGLRYTALDITDIGDEEKSAAGQKNNIEIQKIGLIEIRDNIEICSLDY